MDGTSKHVYKRTNWSLIVLGISMGAGGRVHIVWTLILWLRICVCLALNLCDNFRRSALNRYTYMHMHALRTISLLFLFPICSSSNFVFSLWVIRFQWLLQRFPPHNATFQTDLKLATFKMSLFFHFLISKLHTYAYIFSVWIRKESIQPLYSSTAPLLDFRPL